MKFLNSGRLIMAEAAALGWFLLKPIPYTAILVLIPAAVIFCVIPLPQKTNIYLQGISVLAGAVISSMITALSLDNGSGWLSLLFLLVAVAAFAPKTPEQEWKRITNWWGIAFLVVFLLILPVYFSEVKWIGSFPADFSWIDIVIFYLLVFLGAFTGGKESKMAPLALGILLLPFSLLIFSVLGQAGFAAVESPNLSLWSGATFFAFYRPEGLINALYFGIAAFQTAEFSFKFKKSIAIEAKT